MIAFATEPVFVSLANVVGYYDNLPSPLPLPIKVNYIVHCTLCMCMYMYAMLCVLLYYNINVYACLHHTWYTGV